MPTISRTINTAFLNIQQEVVETFTDLQFVSAVTTTDTKIEGLPDFSFKVEFCRSTDFYNYSDWEDIALMGMSTMNPLVIYQYQIRYTIQVNTPGAIYNGSCTAQTLNFIYTQTVPASVKLKDLLFNIPSVFGDLDINDIELNRLRYNLLEKAKGTSILPSSDYIERSDDFIVWWDSICFYLAMHWRLMKETLDIVNIADSLLAYLTQRGAFLPGKDWGTTGFFSLTQLVWLQREISRFWENNYLRGTFYGFKFVTYHNYAYSYNWIPNQPLQSLLEYVLLDTPTEGVAYEEWIFVFLRRKHVFQKFGNGSVFYRGLSAVAEINKIVNIDYHHCLPNANPIVTTEVDNYGVAIPSAFALAEGNIDNSLVTNALLLPPEHVNVIHNHLDYELSFFLKVASRIGPTDKITVAMDGWDITDSPVSFKQVSTGAPSNIIINAGDLQNLQTGIYYHFRFIIFSSLNSTTTGFVGEDFINGLIPNFLGHLEFDATHAKIYPNIILEGSVMKYLYGLRVAPLRNDFSLGFICPPNIMLNYHINNNKFLQESKYKDIVDKNFIPANSVVITKDLGAITQTEYNISQGVAPDQGQLT